MQSHARVVVIGGGVVGCSVLYHLARFGCTDALLIERALGGGRRQCSQTLCRQVRNRGNGEVADDDLIAWRRRRVLPPARSAQRGDELNPQTPFSLKEKGAGRTSFHVPVPPLFPREGGRG